VALATVVETWGSAPRPIGAHLITDAEAHFEGSVSGGCIEGSVIHEGGQVIARGTPALPDYGVSRERAWEMGLACGGTIKVFVEPLRRDQAWLALLQARAARRPVARVVRLKDGAHCVLLGSDDVAIGPLHLEVEARAAVTTMIRAERNGYLPECEEKIFVAVYPPPKRLLLVGAVHIAQCLAPMATSCGFQVTLIDPRRAFASEERFPGINLDERWPDLAIKELCPDASSAVVTLSHDAKLDDPALSQALLSPAFYVGALGSRRTHAKRLARLGKHFSEEQLARIHAPVGLDLGGRSPAHIAVSILAQMIQVKFKGK